MRVRLIVACYAPCSVERYICSPEGYASLSEKSMRQRRTSARILGCVAGRRGPYALAAVPMLIAVALLARLPLADAASPARKRITPTVSLEGQDLIFESAAGERRRPLAGWGLHSRPPGKLIGLVRPGARGTEVMILDRAGVEVGSMTVPAGASPVVTDQNVITVPPAPHEPEVAHRLSFRSLKGALLREVSESALTMFRGEALADGRMVTVNRGPRPEDRTIIVYGAAGQVTWRLTVPGPDFPEVTTTPDNRRLVLLRPDRMGAVEISVVAGGNHVLARHRLSNVYGVLSNTASSRVAVVGQHVVGMIEARTGQLLWKHDDAIDLVLPGGFFFDDGSRRLVVVAGRRDLEAETVAMTLRTFRQRDGHEIIADMGATNLRAIPAVIGVERTPAGRRRVRFRDRVVEVVERP